MTDDKEASEGPYGIDETIEIKPFVFVRIDSYAKLEIANAAFAYGRKSERERCAEIAREHFSCEGIAQEIEKKILGGQDGK